MTPARPALPAVADDAAAGAIYRGPQTKAAQALIARAERTAQRRTPGPAAPPRPSVRAPARYTAVSQVAAELGITVRAIRHWEAEGLIACQRDARNGRIVDEAGRDTLALIAGLRQAGVAIAELVELLDAGDLHAAIHQRLQARLSRLDAERAAIARLLEAAPWPATPSRADDAYRPNQGPPHA